MKTQITGREWEDLSAYLDGQLSPKESTRLEEKLQASAGLRLALEELSRTRTLLRSQPPVRAPRNFLLSPKMVGERRAPAPANRLFPVMRLASALAMALFVLALAGDFLSSGRQPGVLPVAYQSVEMPAPAAVMKEASQADAPPVGEAIELQVATEAPAMEAPAEAKLAPPPAPTLGAAMLQESGAGAEAYPPPAADLAAGAAAVEQVTPTPLPAEPTAPPIAQERNAVQDSSATAFQASPPWSGWRLLEIALGLLALVTAGWAFYLWRSKRT